jgi:hypothetical protein
MANAESSGDPSADGVRTVTLTATQYESLMYAALDQAARSMTNADEIFGTMRDSREKAKYAEDVQTAMKIVREDFDMLDALGWPDEEGEDR